MPGVEIFGAYKYDNMIYESFLLNFRFYVILYYKRFMILVSKMLSCPLRAQVRKPNVEVFSGKCAFNTIKVSKVIFSILCLSFNSILTS